MKNNQNSNDAKFALRLKPLSAQQIMIQVEVSCDMIGSGKWGEEEALKYLGGIQKVHSCLYSKNNLDEIDQLLDDAMKQIRVEVSINNSNLI